MNLRSLNWKNIFRMTILRKSIYTKDLLGKDYSIGDYTYGKPIILKWGKQANLRIGKYCCISGRVCMILEGEHRTDWITMYPFSALKAEWPEGKDIRGHPSTKGDIIIGNDVWLGYGTIVLSGVTIGDGAVVAAGSVVTNNVQPYSIVGGNPARLIGKRFDDSTIAELLKIRWWEWPENRIRENIHLLCSERINELIELYGSKRKYV